MRRLVVAGSAVGALLALALAAPVLGLANPISQDMAHRLAGSMPGSPLGRDEFGRDVLSRLIWGGRVSLSVALASVSFACVGGVGLGLIGGWFRRWGALLAVRSMDVLLCFPPVLLALLVVTLMGPGAETLIFVLSILFLPGFTRVTYAEVLSVRGRDYVEAARAMGCSPARILLRTVLPNVLGPVLVQVSLAAGAAVVLESGLSFLGLGVVPPDASWGLMIRGARATMAQAPLLLLWPCLALTVTVLAINLFCDALRDWIDPRAARPRRRLLDAVRGRWRRGTVLRVQSESVP